MPDGYGSHADYMAWAFDKANTRQTEIEKELREAFSAYIESRPVDVIVFSSMSAMDLAAALHTYPAVLKPLVAVCNIAGRAIERDLQIRNLDTYAPRLTEAQANTIAGYIKPFLPPFLEIPALSSIDRLAFIDKEIRMGKGQWEKKILKALNTYGTSQFKKRKFKVGDEKFELDAATPLQGDIKIGIDVKRVEARRDIHKRCDEIVNKAAKLKSVHAASRFAAVIYYPFIDEHTNVQNRLVSENIEAVVFAAESDDSVENAVRMLLAQLGAAR